MNTKHFLLFSFCLLMLTRAMSQVSVNPLTGAASVDIPIYTVNSGQISAPIRLLYSGTGVKTRDVEGSAGMGWQVETGGQISIQVRGLPDDCTKGSIGSSRLGWMSPLNTGAAIFFGCLKCKYYF